MVELRRRISAIAIVLMLGILTVGPVVAQDVGDKPSILVAPQDRPIHSLRDLNQAYVDLVADIKPAVVTVSTERLITAPHPLGQSDLFEWFFGPRDREQPDERQYRQRGLGSGIIVSSDGYVLTNNHVIEDVDSIYVRTFDGNRYSATVVGTDPKTDIAVLRIESENLDYLEPGNSDDLQVGEIVMAVGSPMSASLAYTVTQGIVSAKGRANVGLADYEDFIQTDAAINPGNSGGPLVNLDGELVGINTAIVSRSGGFQGIGFAVPVNMATRVMNQLITTGRVVRGWLGVYIQDVSDNLADALSLDDPDGALVSEVVPGSPADEAGLEAGDVIIELDGQAVPNSAQLRNHVASTPPGTNVTMLVVREGHDKNITVKLGELPGDEPIAATSREDSFEDIAGFTVRTLDRESANRYDISQNLSGVIVTSIDPASNAFSAGLREGDLIIAIDRQQIESRSDFADAVSDAERGDKILLRVHRDGAGFFMAFTL